MTHLHASRTNISAEDLAWVFLDRIYALHGMPDSIISDREPRINNALWQELFKVVGTRLELSTAFHPQTDGRTERANRTVEEMLRHYVGPYQDDWDRYLPLAEFAINNSEHAALKTTPFFLNYGQHPRTPVTATHSRLPSAQNLLADIHKHVKRSRVLLEAANQRSKSYEDRKRRDETFTVGQMVLLSTKQIRIKDPGARKLWPKYVGPFSVAERIGAVAYRLELPANWKLHNVFHVSRLRPYRSDGSYQPPPPVINQQIEGEDPAYEVEAILDTRLNRTKAGKLLRKEYLVRWKGYGPEHNTWEPESNLINVEDVMKEFMHKNQGK